MKLKRPGILIALATCYLFLLVYILNAIMADRNCVCIHSVQGREEKPTMQPRKQDNETKQEISMYLHVPSGQEKSEKHYSNEDSAEHAPETSDIKEKHYSKSGQENMTKTSPLFVQQEQIRRIKNHLKEMWLVVAGAYQETEKQMPDKVRTRMRDMLELFDEIRTHSENMITELLDQDGAKQKRDTAAKNLSQKIQKNIYNTQHPANCSSARKLICRPPFLSGYASQVHLAYRCYLQAFITNRVAITPSEWVFNLNPRSWMGCIFADASPCATSFDKRSAPVKYGTHQSNDNIVEWNGITDVGTEFQPQRVPKKYYKEIRSFHSYPYVWWVGQMVKSFFVYESLVQKRHEMDMRNMRFQRPIVGVHIRRTDKTSEAQYFELDDYMFWVDVYFKRLSLSQKVDKKRVYIATDDADLFYQATTRYKNYEILGDPQHHRRGTNEETYEIARDVEILSETDYLVCTFSSNVCRLAYEIMNSKHTDASERFHSLDTGYVNVKETQPTLKAVYSHQAKNHLEISFNVGDIILSNFDGLYPRVNQWNGYSNGTHNLTGKKGLFPSFKAERIHLMMPKSSD